MVSGTFFIALPLRQENDRRKGTGQCIRIIFLIYMEPW